MKNFYLFIFKTFFYEKIENLRKIVNEWNSHLEIFSCPQVTENSWRYLPLQTDILQSLVAPDYERSLIE